MPSKDDPEGIDEVINELKSLVGQGANITDSLLGLLADEDSVLSRVLGEELVTELEKIDKAEEEAKLKKNGKSVTDTKTISP